MTPARWLVRGVVVLALASGLAAPRASGGGRQIQPQTPMFKTEVEVVRVDVRVERSGATVRGLCASDFELRDDGVPQRIVEADYEQVPLDVLLALDVSDSVTETNARQLRDAAAALLAGLAPDDRAGLLTFGGRASLTQSLTPDKHLVRQRLADLRGHGSTALNDAIFTAIRLRDPGDTRGAVLVLTDGIDNTSWLSADDVIEAARRSDVIVHVVVVDLPGARVRASDNPLLHAVAHHTGGEVWPASWGPELKTAFEGVLLDLRTRYVVTYYPTGVSGTGWHTLDVRLTRGSGKVKARPGYFRTREP